MQDEKAEKIRVALAKMRAASVTRLYVKAFSLDGSSKALMVDGKHCLSIKKIFITGQRIFSIYIIILPLQNP